MNFLIFAFILLKSAARLPQRTGWGRRSLPVISGSAAAQGAEAVTFFSGSRSIYFSFHPEVIINGNRLINDFPDIELNRRYIVLEGWKLVDITYSKPDSAPEPESLRAVVKKLCSKMLSVLDKYFNVDYRVSLVFGTAKSEYTGLAPNIREALIKTF